MSSLQKESKVTNDKWAEKWVDGAPKPGWHLNDVNPNLKMFFEQLKAGVDHPHVLVPLCGATVDLKWLVDQGCTVTGVEYSTKAVEKFFADHQLEYEKSEFVNGLNYYAAKSLPLRIIQGDFYATKGITLDKNVDAVYDRGSFVAVDLDDREKYRDTILSLLKTYGVSLLVTMDYDDTVFGGPPHAVKPDQLEAVWSPNFDIKLLHHGEEAVSEEQKERWGISKASEYVYLLKRRP